MMDPDQHWRWLVYGLGGLSGMIQRVHTDGLKMTAQQLQQLNEHIGQLMKVAAEQRDARSETTPDDRESI